MMAESPWHRNSRLFSYASSKRGSVLPGNEKMSWYGALAGRLSVLRLRREPGADVGGGG